MGLQRIIVHTRGVDSLFIHKLGFGFFLVSESARRPQRYTQGENALRSEQLGETLAPQERIMDAVRTLELLAWQVGVIR